MVSLFCTSLIIELTVRKLKIKSVIEFQFSFCISVKPVLAWREGSHHRGDGEEVGMVAALLQVHHDVEQGHLVPSTFGVQSLKVSSQDELVIFSAGEGTD